MHHSMSFQDVMNPKENINNGEMFDPKLAAFNQASIAYLNNISDYSQGMMLKSRRGPGAVNSMKGHFEPDSQILRWGYDSRGIRQRFFNLSFEILREIAQRTVTIGAIHNVRCMQVRPFCQRSYNDNDIGFRIKLKNKEATPDRRQKRDIEEIEEFFINSGILGFNGAEDREEDFNDVIEMLTREVLTIDQVAISLRRNMKGEIIEFKVLDGATIKRIMNGREENFGGKDSKFVQEIDGKILDVFTNDDIIFTYMNKRADIRKRGYGYSYEEMCIDMITAWLFAMSYNKEVFNSGAQPKGIITFEGDKIDQSDLEELQREWLSMFRGVKGMWRTPFLQHNAKWIPMNPSNRDMEYNQYTQMLSSWICAIHGIDQAELGVKLNQGGNMMFENQEAKLAYSKDRGLRDLLFFHSSWMNKLIKKVDKWREYQAVFTGIEAKSQQTMLEVDKLQVSTFMTVNEKRKEKDLPPLPDGDVILDPTYMNMVQQKQMAEQSGEQQGQGPSFDEGQEDESQYENNPLDLRDEDQKEEGMEKSLKVKKDDFIEIIL